MSTYDTLRDRALNRTGLLGQSEAQTVAQMALEEAMKFVASMGQETCRGKKKALFRAKRQWFGGPPQDWLGIAGEA